MWGKPGLIKRDGSVIIPLEYDSLFQSGFEDANGWITLTGSKNNVITYFEVKGAETKILDSQPVNAASDNFSDGLERDCMVMDYRPVNISGL